MHPEIHANVGPSVHVVCLLHDHSPIPVCPYLHSILPLTISFLGISSDLPILDTHVRLCPLFLTFSHAKLVSFPTNVCGLKRQLTMIETGVYWLSTELPQEQVWGGLGCKCRHSPWV